MSCGSFVSTLPSTGRSVRTFLFNHTHGTTMVGPVAKNKNQLKEVKGQKPSPPCTSDTNLYPAVRVSVVLASTAPSFHCNWLSALQTQQATLNRPQRIDTHVDKTNPPIRPWETKQKLSIQHPEQSDIEEDQSFSAYSQPECKALQG